VKAWITGVGSRTARIERGSPCENGDAESFNARLRDEPLNGEVFHSLAEARSQGSSGVRSRASREGRARKGYEMVPG
jgi:hypothetical protein